MIRSAGQYFTDSNLMLVGMIIFLTFFLTLLAWVNRTSAKELHGKLSQLPLKDEVNL